MRGPGLPRGGRVHRAALCLLILVASCGGPTAAAISRARVDDGAELERLVDDVCDKQVVLLGEATHGDAATWAAKAAVMHRLIERCGFGAVLFESGIYDFVELEQRLAARTATVAQLEAAIGGLWLADETRGWIAALFERAAAGAIALGGLDDQLSATAAYAQERLPGVLAAHLGGDARARCETAIGRHARWEYDEHTPYDAAARAEMLGCLRDIQAAATGEDAAMAASFARMLERDDLPGEAVTDARDRSMFVNARWHLARLPPDRKVVIWTATIHAARSLDARDTLGAHLHGALGDRVAAIGFSALAGSYAMVRKPVTELAPAPPTSLEAQAFASPGGTLRYLGPAQLAAAGAIDARPLDLVFQRLRWADVLDGIVVVRTATPPHF